MARSNAETTILELGLIEAEDAEMGARAWLDVGDEAVRQRFAQEAAGARESRRRTLASLGVDVVEITTDRSYVAPLLSYFQARARRR